LFLIHFGSPEMQNAPGAQPYLEKHILRMPLRVTSVILPLRDL
jgi:hypothetical protein